jgi:hypothetical protein
VRCFANLKGWRWRWNGEHVPQSVRVLFVGGVCVEGGYFDICQGNAGTLGVDLGNAHIAKAKGAWAVVCADDKLTFAHQEEGFLFVHCASQDCACWDVHGASVEAIAEGVIDRHLNLWELEQLGFEAIDWQVRGWHLLFDFLSRDVAHWALL